MIFNIQRYSIHDGPGIHTIVSLKSCSLSCRWYQNPEDRARTQGLLCDVRLYLEGCELYTKAVSGVIECALNGLPIHRGELTPEHLTALTDHCPTQALTVCGEVKSVKEIVITVLHDKPFYDRSSGGLTPPSGEPFIQPEMAMTLPQVSHEIGIHTVIETYLCVPWKYIAPPLPYIDLLLVDLKHVADVPSKQWIDGNAVRVLDSLKKSAAAGKKITIRIPLIQGFNAGETSVETIADFATDELHVDGTHFLPYHTLGINKYHLLNLPYDAPGKPLDAPELLGFAQQYACQKESAATLRG